MPKNQKSDSFGNEKFFEFECKIIRFKITEDTYKTVFTNLERNELLLEIIIELYNIRRRSESSIREQTYAIGLNAFHAKKDSIRQEKYTKLLFYNFSEK